MSKWGRISGFIIASAMVLALASCHAPQETGLTVLRGAGCFPQGTYYSKRFEDYVKAVNSANAGLRIHFLGGSPKILPTYEVGRALKDGVLDIAICSPAFYQNLVPEADAMKLSEYDVTGLRETGAFTYLDQLHQRKLNAKYLGIFNNHSEYHIYLTKPLAGYNLEGRKIRVSPVYKALVERLGGVPVTSAPSDVYTMLERGNIDGYGWPVQGIFDFSWQDVTRYRIDPGFYRTNMSLFVNLDAWRGLTPAQRDLLQSIALKFEREDVAEEAVNREELVKQSAAGIRPITLNPEESKTFLDAGREAGWSLVIENNPCCGERLKHLLSRERDR